MGMIAAGLNERPWVSDPGCNIMRFAPKATSALG